MIVVNRYDIEVPQMHACTAFSAIIAVGIIYSYRNQMKHRLYLLYGLGSLFIMGLGLRAMVLSCNSAQLARRTRAAGRRARMGLRR